MNQKIEPKKYYINSKMPMYQIVSVRFGENDVPYGTASLYKFFSKKISTLLLEGWKCQGGVVPIYEDERVVELIQAMTFG